MNNGLGLIIAIFVLMMLAVWLFAAAPDTKADRYKNEAQEEPAPVYGLIYVLRSHYHFERGRDRLLRRWLNLVGIFTVVGHNFSWVLTLIRRELGIKVQRCLYNRVSHPEAFQVASVTSFDVV
jgi:hypothetical protein